MATKAPTIITMTLFATTIYLLISFVLLINFEQQTHSEKANPITTSNYQVEDAVALSCGLAVFIMRDLIQPEY